MNNRKVMLLGSIALGAILIFSLSNVEMALASKSSDRKMGDIYQSGNPQLEPGSKVYREECGSCHLAFAPQLLPPQSWDKIMSGLEDHFGENAELDSETQTRISEYLFVVSDQKNNTFSKMQRNLGNKTPLRITELPYFVHEHDDIPSRLLKGNDKLSSLSQCEACHQNAEKGWFDEDDVSIPGFGRWHD